MTKAPTPTEMSKGQRYKTYIKDTIYKLEVQYVTRATSYLKQIPWQVDPPQKYYDIALLICVFDSAAEQQFLINYVLRRRRRSLERLWIGLVKKRTAYPGKLLQ